MDDSPLMLRVFINVVGPLATVSTATVLVAAPAGVRLRPSTSDKVASMAETGFEAVNRVRLWELMVILS